MRSRDLPRGSRRHEHAVRKDAPMIEGFQGVASTQARCRFQHGGRGVRVPAEGRCALQELLCENEIQDDKGCGLAEAHQGTPKRGDHVVGISMRKDTRASKRRRLDSRSWSVGRRDLGLVCLRTTAMRIPSGRENFAWQIHYTPNGKAVKDRCRSASRRSKPRSMNCS